MNVARNPVLEALFEALELLAYADHAAGREPRTLEGELAAFQAEYEAYYTAAMLAEPLN